CHLDLLGVDVYLQGKGLGTTMLKHLISRMDEQDDSCYLETSKKLNVKLYKRFGFIVLHKERVCEEGPLMRYMKVPPTRNSFQESQNPFPQRPRKSQSKEELFADATRQLKKLKPTQMKLWITTRL